MNRPLPAELPLQPLERMQPPAIRERQKPRMRRYDIRYLTPNGEAADLQKIAPATRTFEETSMAFARGSLLATPGGQMAIEDLMPGDEVITQNNGPQTVLWIGSTTISPSAHSQMGEAATLTRIATEALGYARPAQDVMLAYGARLYTPKRGDQPETLMSVQDIVDGETVFRVTPPSPVEVFHIVLRRHGRVLVNGLEVETFHPGPRTAALMRNELRSLYISMFPHLRALEDFGPLCAPRSEGLGLY